MGKICIKCGYERTGRDDPFVQDTTCPTCGVIYAKAEARLRPADVASERREAPQESSQPQDPAPVQAQRPVAEKNIWIAIGLNLIVPGLGYLYMGRDVAGLVLILAMLSALFFLPLAMILVLLAIPMQIIMALDIAIRHRKLIAAASRACPHCAEPIRIQATVCRYCGRDV